MVLILVLIHLLFIVLVISSLIINYRQKSQYTGTINNSSGIRVRGLFISKLRPKAVLRKYTSSYKYHSVTYGFFYGLKVTCIQYYHNLLSIFTKRCKLKTRLERSLLYFISGVGIYFSTEFIIEGLEDADMFIDGFLGLIISRSINAFWTLLLKAHKDYSVPFSSSKDLVVRVEAKVQQRLEEHSKNRKIIGFFLVFLYYAAIMFIIISNIVSFSDNNSSQWVNTMLLAYGLDIFLVESLAAGFQMFIALQISKGLPRNQERFLRFWVSKEFIKLFE